MLGDKQKTKFGGVMSAQNTHHIPAFYHVFGFISYSNKRGYSFISDYSVSCAFKGTRRHLEAARRLGEPNPTAVTLRSEDMAIFISPTSQRCRDLISEISLDLRGVIRT